MTAWFVWGRTVMGRGTAAPGRTAETGRLAMLLLLVVPSGILGGCGREGGGASEPAGSLAVAEILGGAADEGFLRADGPRQFTFPQDHGPHPGFRNEWWYFTGNLEGPEEAPMGYQLTLFRAELAPSTGKETGNPEASAWRTRTAWMGHLAVTDGGREIHEEAERFGREALNLAGAQGEPLRVWLEDWEVTGREGGFRLQARTGDLGVDLDLRVETPPVLQGEDGLSPKGPELGNASYYYSIPRLSTEGSIAIAGREIDVTGTSWLDREWSTSALSEGVVGWDWFALRLSDGWSMMVYDLRRADGSVTEFSHAVLMDPSGAKRSLSRSVLDLRVLDRWESPVDGARYPSGWRISVPSLALELRVDPLIRDQEMDLTFRYWEGAVRVEGEREGRPVSGEGFVELTGYAGLAPGGR